MNPLAGFNESLYAAAEEDDLDKLNQAIEAGADIEYESHTNLKEREKAKTMESKNNTALCVACYRGFMPIVLRLLELNAKVNTNNSERQTPLHIASSQGHLDVVLHLLARGADLSALDIHNKTPLHFSTTSDIALLLLDRGAEPNAKTKSGDTPLTWASNRVL